MLVDGILVTKELYDVLVVVQATCLKFGTERRINLRRHLMFNFVPNPDEKSKIVGCIAVNWARLLIQTSFKLPKFVCALCCAVETPSFSLLLKIPIFGSKLAEETMQHVGPSDIHQHDEHFGFEVDLWVVKNLNGSKSGLPRLVDQLL